MEFAGKTNAGTAVTTGEAVALLAHHLPQFVELLEGSVLHGQFSDGPFDHAPGEEHLAGLFHRGAGHHRAAVRPQQHHAFVGQARQGAADDGAADAEDLAQRFLAQLGARCQTLLEDRLENMRVDDVVLGTTAASLAGTRRFLQRLQLFVHGLSRHEGKYGAIVHRLSRFCRWPFTYIAVVRRIAHTKDKTLFAFFVHKSIIHRATS
ncbi:hypothetical protein D3C72_1526330 [compost metagenome]